MEGRREEGGREGGMNLEFRFVFQRPPQKSHTHKANHGFTYKVP